MLFSFKMCFPQKIPMPVVKKLYALHQFAFIQRTLNPELA